MSYLKAPPHTRGSTCKIRLMNNARRGSPAHAGIDLAFFLSASALAWLPRTRGDRPPEARRRADHLPAPPHTRGSTFILVHDFVQGWGSPAHAGIDPPPAPSPSPRIGLPRTRGDRPHLTRLLRASGLAPPHTRGSTCQPPWAAACPAGSPAHAGIDPISASLSRSSNRLPRTRGDRPQR